MPAAFESQLYIISAIDYWSYWLLELLIQTDVKLDNCCIKHNYKCRFLFRFLLIDAINV
jgi:hypothetical protein